MLRGTFWNDLGVSGAEWMNEGSTSITTSDRDTGGSWYGMVTKSDLRS
jgi:hypothetical protein